MSLFPAEVVPLSAASFLRRAPPQTLALVGLLLLLVHSPPRYRLHRVFHSATSEALRLTEARLLCYACLFVGLELVFILVVNRFYPISTAIDLVTFDEYGPRRLVCAEGESMRPFLRLPRR